ncbi:MAG: superoxide dismutase [Hyphomonadaceae bacterium]
MFTLPPLPYAEDALAPAMSGDTVHTHYTKHHAAYVRKTNEALEKLAWKAERLEDVIARARKEGDGFLFNQAAQAWNHAFFWRSMRPKPKKPSPDFVAAIDEAFGGFDAFRAQFLKRGEGHFGSGYLWLVAKNGKLALTEGHDAETPAASGAAPILGCDLWEHAYYLDHKNERAKYLAAFFDTLIDWEFAESQLAAARGRGDGFAFPKAA